MVGLSSKVWKTPKNYSTEDQGKIVDWLSWKLSGTHKIQRISSSYKGLDKMRRIEKCLANSRHKELQDFREYTSVSELSATILKVKNIAAAKDPEFIARIDTTFHPMCEINKLTKEATILKRTKYDVENEEHEMTLLSLWNSLQPDRELESRVSEAWGDIGFQGNDPATDFRGMGILGLQNLHYLAKYKKTGSKLLAASNHPQYGFSLAITSINLTAVLMQMLESGLLRSHFYFKCSHGGSRSVTMNDLHEAHCSILTDFVKFYQDRKPATIMEFNTHKAAYTETLKDKLSSDSPLLETVQ
ncbi:hypothetical protein ACHWQZ_G010163 [Mnemiopsis leidyi]